MNAPEPGWPYRRRVSPGFTPACPFLQTGTGYVTGNFLADYEEGTAAWRKANIMPVPQPVFQLRRIPTRFLPTEDFYITLIKQPF
jgi:hypothetical protein